jgi:hypothetical protein
MRLFDPAGFATLGLSERLAVVARAGLRRLDQERDLSRLLVRDLARFPDLLAEMGQEEIEPIYRVVAAGTSGDGVLNGIHLTRPSPGPVATELPIPT